MANKLIKLIKLPKISTDGFLCFAQHPEHIPFPIKRIYYIAGVSTGVVRGGHAHKKNKQVLFCIQGSIKIVLDDGKKKESALLKKPNIGVLLEPKIWHEMHNFRKDTILLVLASRKHDPKDYIRDYKEFVGLIRDEKSKTN